MNQKLQEFISKLADLMEGYDAEIVAEGIESEGVSITICDNNGKWQGVEADALDSETLRELINK